MTRFALLPLAAFLAGCVQSQPARHAGPDRAAVVQAIASAAKQVNRCYRSPKVPTSGKRIITRLRVRVAPDGTVSGVPVVLSQSSVTPENQAWAPRMAEAASLAVIRCSPLHLPAELHQGGWDEFELIFSPRLLA
jgi:hypothetical protein